MTASSRALWQKYYDRNLLGLYLVKKVFCQAGTGPAASEKEKDGFPSEQVT